eukprot:sb/3464836/
MLLSLPVEILDHLLLYLPLSSLLSLSSTSKSLLELVRTSRRLWLVQLARWRLALPGDHDIPPSLFQGFELFKRRYQSIQRCERYITELSFTHLPFLLVDIDHQSGMVRECLSDPTTRHLVTLHLTRLVYTERKNEFTDLTRVHYARHLLAAIPQAHILTTLDQNRNVFEGSLAVSQWLGTCSLDPPTPEPYPVGEGVAALAESARGLLTPGSTIEDVLTAINTAMFEKGQFRGETENYYNVENNQIDKVFLSKSGIPITLSIIYHEVARRLGVHLQLTNFPRHFLLGFKATSGDTMYVDAFHKGAIYTRARCLQLCPMAPINDNEAYFAEATAWEVLARLLRNAINFSHGRRGFSFMYNLYKLLHRIQPEFASRDSLTQVALKLGVRCPFLGPLSPDIEKEIEDERERQKRRFTVTEAKPSHVTFNIGQVMLHRR